MSLVERIERALFWRKPDGSRLRCIFVTPLFVMRDADKVRKQVAQIVEGNRYNAVASLLDLQRGRDYIFDGRGPMSPDSRMIRNLRLVLRAGLTPVLIIRNDWAVRTRQKYIPSCDGPCPNAKDFYAEPKITAEKVFLSKLSDYLPYCHVQLNIEPEEHTSAQFALHIAAHLRNNGFKNMLLINPYKAAEVAHEKCRPQLAALGVLFARSLSGSGIGNDPVINLDGNLTVTRETAPGWIRRLEASGRHYILWSRETANSHDKIPGEYL